ncbi:MAG: fructose-bisphosphate aldolase [Planctomycetales bacterium]|nr:fructose-bisphosphate aldolase [Planctomycetales bacterium]
MNEQTLVDTAAAMVAGAKGLLAMDESNPTCNKRFAAQGIPQNEQRRRAYREMIVITSGLSDCISGAILYDETIRQQPTAGVPFIKLLTDVAVIPGIKVDAGTQNLAGHPAEKITEGLDGNAKAAQPGATASSQLHSSCPPGEYGPEMEGKASR